MQKFVRSRAKQLLVAAVAALSEVLVALSGAAANGAELDALRSRALALVNEARGNHGLEPLQLDRKANAAAQAHADDMRKRAYYAHVSPEGDTVQDRYEEAGGSKWRLIAENIARCADCMPPAEVGAVERLHRGWMESPGHRENILKRGVSDLGFGIAVDTDRGLYAVQTFAGAGLPRGLDPGERAEALPIADRPAKAAAWINRARQEEQQQSLERSAMLDGAAHSLLADAGPVDDVLSSGNDLYRALPPEERRRWRAIGAVAGVCGGCGTVPTAADIRYFVHRWLEDSNHRASLTSDRWTNIGFAMTANGQGRKSALVLLGRQ